MKLILNTYNPSETIGFNYAFVDLDADLARLILQRREAFRRVHRSEIDAHIDGDALACMQWRDYSVMFISDVPDGVSVQNCHDGGDFDETDRPKADFIDYAERTDCARMCITESYVYWSACPHNTDMSFTVETNPIDFETIERVVKEEVAA